MKWLENTAELGRFLTKAKISAQRRSLFLVNICGLARRMHRRITSPVYVDTSIWAAKELTGGAPSSGRGSHGGLGCCYKWFEYRSI